MTMKMRESCRAPWELGFYVLVAAIIAAVFLTNFYAYIGHVIAFAMCAIAFYGEREPFNDAGKDSYEERIARFGLVLLIGVFAVLIVALGVSAATNMSSDAGVHYLLIDFGIATVGVFIGWIASWFKRCIVWE